MPKEKQQQEQKIYRKFDSIYSKIIRMPFNSLTLKTWGLGFAAGAIWLFSWYAPIPLWIGVILGWMTFICMRGVLKDQRDRKNI